MRNVVNPIFKTFYFEIPPQKKSGEAGLSGGHGRGPRREVNLSPTFFLSTPKFITKARCLPHQDMMYTEWHFIIFQL